jgi:hypothetical protein
MPAYNLPMRKQSGGFSAKHGSPSPELHRPTIPMQISPFLNYFILSYVAESSIFRHIPLRIKFKKLLKTLN